MGEAAHIADLKTLGLGNCAKCMVVTGVDRTAGIPMVKCNAAPKQRGHSCGFVPKRVAKECPGPDTTYEEREAYLMAKLPPPDS